MSLKSWLYNQRVYHYAKIDEFSLMRLLHFNKIIVTLKENNLYLSQQFLSKHVLSVIKLTIKLMNIFLKTLILMWIMKIKSKYDVIYDFDGIISERR